MSSFPQKPMGDRSIGANLNLEFFLSSVASSIVVAKPPDG